jgi:hypothetical protein
VKKTYVVILLVLCCASGLLAKDDLDLGSEYIKPLKYPKFSISADYNMFRRFHGFADSGLRYKLDNNFGVALSFETGLYKYFNAGAIFAANIPTEITKSEPLHMRFALFAKPYYPITKNFSVFSRVGGGISTTIGSMIERLRGFNSPELNPSLERVYQGQRYALMGPGILGMATVGVEYFMFSRFGLAFETGIRVEAFYVSKGSELIERFAGANRAGVGKNSFTYMIYEIPLMLTLHVIL